MTGILVLLVAVAVATGLGLWRRATDGTLREVGGDKSDDRWREPIAGVLGGGSTEAGQSSPTQHRPDGPVPSLGRDFALTPSQVGAALGERATLVQFSTAFCAPCRATRAVLADVAGMVPGVVHVEVDAESHLDLVRRLDVRRTPTVLVLDRDGLIRRRAVGAPRRVDVLAALGEVV
jgi:thiol-disulfide isomerase/thioredoxin